MNIDRNTLEHELEGLQLQLQQAEAQVNMLRGAMQTITQLLEMLDKPDESNNGEGVTALPQ